MTGKSSPNFELDQAAVLQYKEKILCAAQAQPTCSRQVIEADLTMPWAEAIIKHGFDPQQPSAWLLEGFLFYLSNPAITQIVDAVTSLAAPGSWLGFDIINEGRTR